MMARHTELRPLTEDKDLTSLSVNESSLGSAPQSVKDLEGSYDSCSGYSSSSNQGSNKIQDGNGDVARIASKKRKKTSSPICSPSALTSSLPQWQTGTDSNVSWNASLNSGTDMEPCTTTDKRRRTCSLCKNHQVTSALAGHKKYCFFKYCDCSKCCKTKNRRAKSAIDVAIKRELDLEKKQIRMYGKVMMKPVKPMKPEKPKNNHAPTVPELVCSIKGHYHGDGDSDVGDGSGINNIASNPTSKKVPVGETHIPPLIHHIQLQSNANNMENVWEHNMTLQPQIRSLYDLDILKVIYAIMKCTGGNINEVLKRFNEASNYIRRMEWQNYLEEKFLNDMLYAPRYMPMTSITGAPTYEGQAPLIGNYKPPQHPEYFKLLPHLQNASSPNATISHTNEQQLFETKCQEDLVEKGKYNFCDRTSLKQLLCEPIEGEYRI